MLTRAGRHTLMASAALYGAAFALGYPALAVPAAGGAIALAAALLTVARRPRLQVTVSVTPARLSRGQQVTANVAVRNNGRSRSPGFVLDIPHGPDRTLVPVRHLASGHDREIPLTLRCDRRGLIPIGPLTVQQGDLLGLCRRRQVAAGPATVYVYPVVHPVPLPVSPRLRHPDGTAPPLAPDGGITFHSLREYVPGDDLRYVHWLASARLAGSSGNLLVRRHVDPGDASSAVLLDTCARSYPAAAPGPGPGPGEESFEAAVDLAASVLTASARAGFRSCLHTTGGMTVLASPGRDSTRRILDALARVQPGDQELAPAWQAAARTLRARRAGTGTLTLITGTGSEVPGAVLRSLCTLHERVIIARLGQGGGSEFPLSAGEIPGPQPRLHAFGSATAAGAAKKWAAIVAPERARTW